MKHCYSLRHRTHRGYIYR